MISRHRRRFLELVAAAGTVALAGCSDSGGGDGGDTSGDGGDETTNSGGDDTPPDSEPATTANNDGETETATDTETGQTTEDDEPSSGEGRDLGDPDGAVGEIVPDELDIVELNSRVGSESTVEGVWVTDVTVENTGDQQTAVDEYTYRVTLRDDSGSELYSGFARGLFPNDQPTEIASGETTTFIVSAEPPEEGDPDEVASYEVSITCEIGADGVYCDAGPGP